MFNSIDNLLEDVDDGGLRRFSQLADGVVVNPFERASFINPHRLNLLSGSEHKIAGRGCFVAESIGIVQELGGDEADLFV